MCDFPLCSSSGKNPQKKKFCPDCGTQIARKCKKCPTCGKRFGVFTFGRKLCPGCGRVNLARMTACYECGHSMQFAQKALPKGTLGDGECAHSNIATIHVQCTCRSFIYCDYHIIIMSVEQKSIEPSN